MLNKLFNKKQKPQFTPTPQRQHLVNTATAQTVPTANQQAEEDITQKIYPYVEVNHKHEIYKDAKTTVLSEQEMPANMKPVITSFVEDLQVGFVINWGERTQLMPQQVLIQNPEMTIESLKGLSLQNFVRDFGNNIQLHGMEDNILMVAVGNKYESTLVLLENLWQQLSTFLESDDLYFVVPTRGTFLVSATSNPVARPRLRELVRDCFERGADDLLSKAIYVKEKAGMIRVVDVAF
ncbi:MAG: hypothetical protein RLZZ292_984 [Bacteroidota bacterium]|jgi:hypothetical protein